MRVYEMKKIRLSCETAVFQLVEKVCFSKKCLFSIPIPKPLSPVKGCVCLVGSASCRALGHTRPASVPGLSVGLPPLDPVGGYAPATPFLSTIEVYRQSEIRLSCETAVFYKDSYRKISVFLQLS